MNLKEKLNLEAKIKTLKHEVKSMTGMEAEGLKKEIGDLTQQLENEINSSIFHFFDNKLFIDCNWDKKFTEKECAAIIIHSTNTSLYEKFLALEKIEKNSSDEALKTNIQRWISFKKLQCNILDLINKDKDPDLLFIIKFDRYCTNKKVYRTLSKAIEDSFVLWHDIALEVCDDSETGSIANIITYKGPYQPLDIDNSIYDKLADIQIYDNKYLKLPKYHSPLEDITVEFNHPFKPFDFVYIPSINDYFSHVVVADEGDPKIQECIEKNKKGTSNYHGWAKINVINYYLETNRYSGNGVKEGEVTFSLLHQYTYSLSDIHIIDERKMTGNQKAYIEEIKRQLNKIE